MKESRLRSESVSTFLLHMCDIFFTPGTWNLEDGLEITIANPLISPLSSLISVISHFASLTSSLISNLCSWNQNSNLKRSENNLILPRHRTLWKICGSHLQSPEGRGTVQKTEHPVIKHNCRLTIVSLNGASTFQCAANLLLARVPGPHKRRPRRSVTSIS